RKGVQAAGNFSFPEKVPSPACRFRVAERGGGILYFQIHGKRDLQFCVSSPQSGRTKIAQRFIAGYERLIRSSVREADDRPFAIRLKSGGILPPVSRAWNQ